MDPIEYNNKERLKAFSNAPANEMSIRDKIAIEVMSSLIKTMNIHTDESLEEVTDLAVKMADTLIKKIKLNEY
jgi:hypothetical protein